MTPRGPNLTRRADLEAALKRCKKGDVISLQALADLYGTSKSNFTNILRQIERMFDMPQYESGPRGVHIYPAREAIGVVLAYEKRNDAESHDLQARIGRILGRGEKKKDAPAEMMLPVNELATASRIMAETEQREREQGLYVALDDVAETAGKVFSMISLYLGELDAHVDPNGTLSPELRQVIKAGGHTLNLKIHAEMRDMLSGDAIPQSRKPKGSRGPNGRAGGASPRRQGQRRVGNETR